MYIMFIEDYNAKGLGLFKKGSIHKATEYTHHYIIAIEDDMDIDNYPVVKGLCRKITEKEIRKLKLEKIKKKS